MTTQDDADLIADAFERGIQVGRIEAQRDSDWSLYLEGLKVGHVLALRLTSNDPQVREEIRAGLRAIVERFYPKLDLDRPATVAAPAKAEPPADSVSRGKRRTNLMEPSAAGGYRRPPPPAA